MVETLHHIIGGKAVKAENGRFGEVDDPATGEVTARVPFASPDLVDKAVAAAAEAWPAWAATPPLQRARVMFRFKALIEANMTASPPQ